MPELFLHGREVTTVFELLGEKENDITYSVGWALSRSPSFLRQFLRKTINCRGDVSEATIRLQHYRRNEGITDIEIELAGQFQMIVEAKRGWNLPTAKQLKRYAPRLRKQICPIRRILVLSECSSEYAEHHLECEQVQGIKVEAVPWKTVASIAESTAEQGRHAEKRLLRELLSYLGRVTTVQDIESNWVYVVALASGTKEGWGISWIDMVRKRRRYFHKMGVNGWPKEPPNYIAFRYHGRLQSIHHLDSYKVITDLHEGFPKIPSKEREPYFLYQLGPAIVPPKKVRTGNIYANGRVWCMLDALLTCKTVSEARDLSKKRSRHAKPKQ